MISYTAGAATEEGNVTVSDFTVDTGGNVSATLTGGSIGDKVTLPVTVKSGNYNDTTVTAVITLTDKTDAGVSIAGVPEGKVTYGDPDFTPTGSISSEGTGTGSWKWSSSDNDVLRITSDGAAATVKILKAGSAAITADYESDTTMGTETTSVITIDQKTLTVKAVDRNIKVGEAVPDLSLPVLNTDYTVKGLAGTDTLTDGPKLEYASEPDNTKPGTYTITAGSASAGDNYRIIYEEGTLTISEDKPAPAPEPSPTPEPEPVPVPTPTPEPGPAASVTLDSGTANAQTIEKAVIKAGGDIASVTTIVLGKDVKKIDKSAFRNFRKVKTLVVKSKKLKKASVKNSLKGSKITRIKVKVGNKKTSKSYVKKYRKIFTKKNAGRKVKISL